MSTRPGLWRCAASLLWGAGWLLLAGGCATNPGKKAEGQHIFYPPPPGAPRLQFLVSYSGEADLGRKVSKFSTFITGEQAPSQPILKPYGVLLASNQVWVCDTAGGCLDILDLQQKTMRRFAPTGYGKLGVPINVVLDSEGRRYVADTGRNQVMIYGPDESFLGAIGENESLRPTGLALRGSRLYVSDLNGHCVRVYDKDSRKMLFTVPRQPEADEAKEPGKLYMPVNVAVGQDGSIYVSDMAACRVMVYDAEGQHLRSIGSRGDLPGQFARPKGLAVDREGRIYVVDAASQVCQIFDREGKLLLFFGEPGGSGASLDLPASVVVDYEHVPLFQRFAAPGFELEHLVLISNQLGDRKISVYALGHRR